MPTPSVEGVSETWKSSVLRDLAWLLAAPDLVELPAPLPSGGRPTCQELGLTEDPTDWLTQLAPKLAGLEGQLTTRMGHYHEQLWHVLLNNAPNTRLLAKNVRIYQQRTTLGELDMLYRTRDNPAPVHLEVAIKFYLGLPEGPGDATSQSRWIGPGGLDSLALKCAHLRRHQLPMSTSAIARATLIHWLAPRDLGATPPLHQQLSQRLAMPGILFYPYHAELPPPQGATQTHQRGTWCYLKDWPAFAAERNKPLYMAWLKKPHWLAPPLRQALQPVAAVMPGVEQLIEQYGPQQVMLYGPQRQHVERLFIVPNHWPRQVPLPPRPR